MNYHRERFRKLTFRALVLRRSEIDSGRTREMIVIPRENIIAIEEKLKTLSESK